MVVVFVAGRIVLGVEGGLEVSWVFWVSAGVLG